MVIAISVGVLLASLLFIRTIAEMTKAIEQPAPEDLNDVLAYRISGPLFFAAADKLFADLHDKTYIRITRSNILYCNAML